MTKQTQEIALFIATIAISVLSLVYLVMVWAMPKFFQSQPLPTNVIEVPAADNDKANIETVATDLTVPWSVAFLPGGDLLVTERSGELSRIGNQQEVYQVAGVKHTGEGGLMGIALHPAFAQNNLLYLYFTTADSGQKNRVVRFRLDGNRLTDQKIIIDNIPSAIYHDGGRIAFGPDGMLYIATGDASQSDLAQDKNSLAGKILRLKDDGQIPADNPFGTAVYSYGHRNVQGLTWDDQGRLWSTEHGPSGAQTGNDEVNLIIAGHNYGWPLIKGKQTKSGLESPRFESGVGYAWAPASALYYDGSIFFGGLRGEAVFEAVLADDQVTSVKAHFLSRFGRIRDIVIGPDGYFYFTTSNTDGRGKINPGDDKIIKVHPSVLRQ